MAMLTNIPGIWRYISIQLLINFIIIYIIIYILVSRFLPVLKITGNLKSEAAKADKYEG